jgi:DNA-binding beta-propeller fold protein YncE
MAAAGIAGTSGGALAATTPSSSLTIVKSSLSFADVVINPASTFAYFTVPTENEVAVLNLETHKFGKPIPVGSDPQGIDIAPDGKTLLVADTGGQTISQVTIATGKVKTITTPAGTLDDTPYSIVVLDNKNALYSTTFEGSGFGANVYELNLTTDVSTEVSSFGLGGQVTEVTQMSRSWNHAVAGAVLGDDSGGPFDIYTAATGNVVSGSLNNFIGFGSLNGEGTTFLVDGSYVIDAATGTLLGTINDDCVGAVLNRSGADGYCLESGALVALRVSRFLTGASTALPAGVTGTGELAISPNGDLLVGITSAGALIDSL